jgi:DNA helicase-2/ATP-dependent DNA helicase PcrA
MTAMIRTRKAARKQLKLSLTTDACLEGANPEQAEAIAHTLGPIGVFAGAGSGKTRVLCHRIAHLVASGIAADRILAVTFSKKAADEMQARCTKLGCTEARVGTWHSLALQVLREDGLIDGWEVDSKDRAKFVLKDVLGYRGMNWTGADLGKVQSFIAYCKSQLWMPGGADAVEYSDGEWRLNEAYKLYEAELEQRRLLTFDCMLVKCALHLCKEVNRKRWAARWDFILQDEVQDANPVQMLIAGLLARDHQNYMVVGDPAQSIYGFRGSRPEAVQGFGASWSGAKVVTMHRNYRCGSAIIAAANKVIESSDFRLPEALVAEGGWSGGVSFFREASLEDEGERIASIIDSQIKAGEKPEAHTVLYRTNAQSRAIEEALLNRKIPYVVVGGTSFYERKEVKDLLAYLRVAFGRDVVANSRRCLNAPFRFIGAKTLDKISDALKAHKPKTVKHIAMAVEEASVACRLQKRQIGSLAIWAKIIEGLSVARFESAGQGLQWLVDQTGYVEWLQKDQGEENLESSHVANVKELIRVGSRFSTIVELLDFIDSTIAKSKKAKQSGGRVTLMSIHRSKGLEWSYVFIAGACELILPHPYGDEDEERRLFYVALTRAARHAYITAPSEIAVKSGIKTVEPSRFVQEILPLIETSN